ncbi:MAG: septum formation initiator family protein [Alphaproteobacteria bacterium]|nr:septum formation initiator family protein [Alphaproteobacteria bacterium]
MTVVLSGFLAYLGVNAVSGQYGLAGRAEMRDEVAALEMRRATLEAEIDAIRHRLSLLDPEALDPDILTEQAHALLSMAPPDVAVLVENGTD